VPSKFGLSISPPVMNAAGFLGYSPDLRSKLEPGSLGAFITNPISLEPRSPAAGTRFFPFPGGFLLHTGHPNPGLRTVMRRCAEQWRRSPLPVWVHLLVRDPREAAAMVRRLEAVEGIAGFELGLPPGVDRGTAQALIQSSRGELPLVVKVSLLQAAELAPLAAAAGADAISLGAARGILPEDNGRLVEGRLYGPALFPQALLAVQTAAASGIPVIGAGGVYAAWQVQAMLDRGAVAVQLDGVLWKGGWGGQI
jgi:dihydroorotate dehydrogenase (NAD+) catalytic subunit